MTLRSSKVGSVRDIESLKKILVALMSKLNNAKYKTELIKLCFILDYTYCQDYRSKEGPTTVEYAKYNYGPYSDSFNDAFDSLKEQGIICEVNLPFGEGLELSNKELIINLAPGILELLDKIIKEYGTRSLREMKSYIYELKEFKKTEFGNPIALFEE
jgi:uncharacterized protein YwgA